MSLPQPPTILKNVFAGYYLALWNYIVRLIAAITGMVRSPWNIRFVTHATAQPIIAAAGDWINCDTTAGDIAVTIPSALSAQVVVQKTAVANNVNIASDAGAIFGGALPLTVQYSNYTFVGMGPTIGAYIKS